MPDLLKRLGEALGDRYRVEREVGEGGMAVVFLAEDLKHRRRVAIKVMRPQIGASIGPERFLREIEIAARLAHPNILPLHDSGSAGDLLYFVMPYVEGESLRDLLDREGALAIEEAARITCEVADALEYAHTQDLIHRDIKPENILFQAGHAAVTDFGIARAIGEASSRKLTQTGMAVGTVAYMSPEQAAGDTELDARTDVYALGCLLYEMLMGETPYEGQTPQAILAKKVMEPAPSLETEADRIPVTVARVVRKALAPDRQDRYATPKRLAKALTHGLSATAIALEARQTRARGRLRAGAWVAGVALLATGGWWLSTVGSGPTMETLAVLPVRTQSDDSTQAFFVEGVHDAIIRELQLAGFSVISSRSVMKYGDRLTPIGEIAAELGVDGVIEVTLLSNVDSLVIDSLVIDASLMHPETEASLWSDRFGAEMKDVVSVYRGLTRAIADYVNLPLTPQAEARLATRREVDPEAVSLYMKGMSHYRRLTRPDLDLAVQYFELATARDSEYAAAYSGIALALGGKAQMGFASTEEALGPQYQAALERAMELGATLEEVRYVLAVTSTWYDWDWEQAETEYLAAIELNPSFPDTRAYYAQFLLIVGREEEAREQQQRAIELDPFSPQYQALYGMFLNFTERYQEAETVLLNNLEAEPDHGMTQSTLRSTYHMLGKHEEAMVMWRASYASDTEALAALERGYQSGGYLAALGSVADMMVERSDTAHVAPGSIGTLYARAGRSEEAFEWLLRAVAERDVNMPSLAVDHIFDDLRDDPRFQDLLRPLSLPN